MEPSILVVMSSNLVFDYDSFFLSIRNLHRFNESKLNSDDFFRNNVLKEISSKRDLLKPRSHSIDLISQILGQKTMELIISDEMVVPSKFAKDFEKFIRKESIESVLLSLNNRVFSKIFVLNNSKSDLEDLLKIDSKTLPNFEWVHIRNPYRSDEEPVLMKATFSASSTSSSSKSIDVDQNIRETIDLKDSSSKQMNEDEKCNLEETSSGHNIKFPLNPPEVPEVQTKNFQKIFFDLLSCLKTLPQFSFLRFPEPLFRVNASESFNSTELPYWATTFPLLPSVKVEPSPVIRGKGLGRSLGIPTANLPISPSWLNTHKLLPGIYEAKVRFLSMSNPEVEYSTEKFLHAIVSLGYNPQYNQGSLVLEVMIMADFKSKEFYGSEVELFLTAFSRPEAKFSSFEDFIFAMSNDVEAFKSRIKE